MSLMDMSTAMQKPKPMRKPMAKPKPKRHRGLLLRFVILGFLVCPAASTSSGTFPGTLKDWWQPSEGESSSDWDWVDDLDEESLPPSLDQSTDASTSTSTRSGSGGNQMSSVLAEGVETRSFVSAVDRTKDRTEVESGSTKKPLLALQNRTISTTVTNNDESIDLQGDSHAQTPDNSSSFPPKLANSSSRNNTEHAMPGMPDIPSNKPLQTLEKLQQMLDDTDYLTTSRRVRQEEDLAEEYDAEDSSPNSLWTSKDRSKYKRQQRSSRSTTNTSFTKTSPLSPPPPPPPPPQADPNLRVTNPFQHRPTGSTLDLTFSTDIDDPSDTDDGLGYTLPNLPVYFSDDEGDTTDPTSPGNEEELAAASRVAPSFAQQPTLSQVQLHGQPLQQSQTQPQPSNQQLAPPGTFYPAYHYPNTPQIPYGYYPPPPPQLPMQQYYVHPAYTGWGPHGYYYPRPFVPRLESTTVPLTRPRHPTFQTSPPSLTQPSHQTSVPAVLVSTPQYTVESIPTGDKSSRNFRWTLDSTTKLATCLALACAVCYSAVSPYSLPFLEYNKKFYEVLRVTSLTFLVPFFVSIFVVDTSQNQLSSLINGFYHAFTLGYALTFALEILAATITRLAIFCWWEPRVFQLAPQVPLIVAPWVLREQKVLVKPITLIVQDLVTSTIVCPLLEEWIKLVLLQWTIPLDKNFQWITKPSKSNPKRRKWVAEPLDSTPIVNINSYVSSMLVISLGLKLADTIRRVCMYTKADDRHKAFYALCRGCFPIPELCGTVTALGLARRDVLGQKMPLWKLLLPAAVIHGMANFRGMKPIFKWNSSSPWMEMQLYTNFLTPGATLAQLGAKAFPKVMWLIILFRVTGYCVKNYYMINRQALKRTTTYAGKHAAFSAELAAAEMLKKTQKDK